jgi:hypothetical protein
MCGASRAGGIQWPRSDARSACASVKIRGYPLFSLSLGALRDISSLLVTLQIHTQSLYTAIVLAHLLLAHIAFLYAQAVAFVTELLLWVS